MKRTESVYESTPCHRLVGAPIAAEILAQVRREVLELAQKSARPRLVSLTFGDPGAADVYVRNQRRTAEGVGIEFVEVSFPPGTPEAQALAAIEDLDSDQNVTGIILQRPVPPPLSVKRLQAAIRPTKDVEGMHPSSIGQIVYGLSDIGPCTALAAVEMLRRTGLQIKGLEVVVIGHSEIVGKPIAFLLMAEGATVTVCHHMTRSVGMHARRADAVFVAVGKPNLIGADMIKPGAAVIDIGINPVASADGRSAVVGDVNFDGVKRVAGWLTPVPGGVGPVTLAMLMRNTIFAARRQHQKPDRLSHPKPSRSAEASYDQIVIRNLRLEARIGIRPAEQNRTQQIRVNVNLDVRRNGTDSGVVCYDTVVEHVRQTVDSGHIRLVEDLAEAIASKCLEDPRVRCAVVAVEKLEAVQGAEAAGVEIRRVGKVDISTDMDLD